MQNFSSWQTEQNHDWRPLRLLNLYRMVIAGLFLVLVLSARDIQPLAERNRELFQYTALAYLLIGILFSFAIHKQWFRFSIQVPLHFSTDLIAITLLMHASGGITSALACYWSSVSRARVC